MLNIYESTGKLIDQMPIKQEQFILNYNTQSSGLYFYTITTKSAVQHSGKFLIVDSN
ncbi:MAG: T9SS type A sorting domain-containing protein [Saprospiraceae bacterium]|nr:T9SS type A sorting domain-containing protein [Saprospiraceae bacterium]